MRLAHVTVVVVLLSIGLAGCMEPITDDGGPPANDTDGDDDGIPDPGEDCWPGPTRNYDWGPVFMPKPDASGHNGSRAHCYDNGAVTNKSEARFYFVFALTRSSQGTWNVTVHQDNGEVFYRASLSGPQEVHCNAEGKVAPTGNWTIEHEYHDLIGRVNARVCLDRDCFNQCP